jgi:hypothetical protein
MNQLWDIRQPVRTLAEDIVRIRYQETTSEEIEDFMCAEVTVIFRMCKQMRLLQLLGVTRRVDKVSINRVTNSNPVYSHTHTRDTTKSSSQDRQCPGRDTNRARD